MTTLPLFPEPATASEPANEPECCDDDDPRGPLPPCVECGQGAKSRCMYCNAFTCYPTQENYCGKHACGRKKERHGVRE